MKLGYDPEVRYRHLEIDAQARIAWGHDARRVESFLRANEMPSGRIRRVLDDAITRRDHAFRRRGLWDLALAAVISLISLGPAIPVAFADGLRAGFDMLGPYEYVVLLVAVFLVSQGTTRLAFGGSGEGGAESASDPVHDEIVWRLQSGAVLVVLIVVGTFVANLLR